MLIRRLRPAVAFGGRRIAWMLTHEKLLVEYLERATPTLGATITFWHSAQVRLLKLIAPPVPRPLTTVYDDKSKLSITFGPDFLPSLRGLVVVDYGCGNGLEALQMAAGGAERVIGVEVSETALATARDNARRAGLDGVCSFSSVLPRAEADVAVCVDSFEHFARPEEELAAMYDILKPGGCLYASMGWSWYHPRGSHLLELPPWSHLIFSEAAVVGWRRLMRGGQAATYADIGLNQMSVRQFARMISRSPFVVESLELTPIRGLRWLHYRLTRELATSLVRCRLRKSPNLTQGNPRAEMNGPGS